MAVKIELTQVINRPVQVVFRFYALEHVRNHPRWDPKMQLEQVTGGPLRSGTLIRRINSHSGDPVEGTMEVVEFVPNVLLGMVIQDGDVEMEGRALFEIAGEDQTRLILQLELPDMDESMDTSALTEGIQRSLRQIKQLIESET